MNFCGECGTKLKLVCHDCTASIPLHLNTSSPKGLSFDEKPAKIQRSLLGGLTEEILSQRERIEGERRHVTRMFIDMKGFSPLTEKLGPEGTFSLMDQVFEIFIHKIHDYEVTLRLGTKQEKN